MHDRYYPGPTMQFSISFLGPTKTKNVLRFTFMAHRRKKNR